MSEQQKQTEGSTKTTKNTNNSRYMHSIFQECDQLKKEYDNCFNAFFQKFISPEYRHSSGLNNPCEQVHFVYRECVEKVCLYLGGGGGGFEGFLRELSIRERWR
ncbi:unnamed protein product [Meloidogyne enterolobii]|uniref:Uncharacterized protein n=1 Tax=Meloidogyne enterolobii TaxID=390850 RepID=A0ACB0ZXF3_MELEN